MRMLTPTTGGQTNNIKTVIPPSLLSYTSYRIRSATTRIHSMTIDPGTGLAINSEGVENGENYEESHVDHGDHQLDLHQVNHDDDEITGGVSTPFTTSSYLAAVSPEAHNRRKRLNNNH